MTIACLCRENTNGHGGLTHRLLRAIRGFLSRQPPPQCSYADVDPNKESSNVIYRQVVTRSTNAKYTVKFRDPKHIITGIVCNPKDNRTASPEAEVVSGGVSCKHVEILLTPVQEGEWTCCIQIYGAPEEN
jgi:hypothetical protein